MFTDDASQVGSHEVSEDAACPGQQRPVAERGEADSMPTSELEKMELEKLKAELKRVSEEKRILAASSAARIDSLEKDLAAVRFELEQLRAARDQAPPPLEDPATNSELTLLQEDYEALRSEYSLINGELTDRHIDLQQLRSEIAAAQEAAAAEIGALKSIIRKMSVETLALSANGAGDPTWPSTSGTSQELVQAAQGGTGERPHRGHDPLGTAHPGTAATPPSAGAANQLQDEQEADEPIQFQLDSSLSFIPCTSNDEVVDLRVSFNTIRMICGSANVQNCSAYICGLERNGKKEIYIALYQIEDKKSQIYLPSHQPRDASDYDRVMEGAISFTDVVGFIINLEYLGGGAAARAKVLQDIPVLGKR
jgi:hypothetical protein